MSDPEPPSAETQKVLLEVYRAQWSDIHHTRQQDWELSRLILLGVLGVGGLKIIGEHRMLAIATTLRHRQLFREKMTVVRRLEEALGVGSYMAIPSWGRLRWFGVQNLLIVMYASFAALFATLLAGELFRGK